MTKGIKWAMGIIMTVTVIGFLMQATATILTLTTKTDISDTSIKTCMNVDGSGDNQTYPCKTVNQPYYPEKVVIYYRGSDAGCPIVNGAKCIDVDDWLKSDS